MDRRDFLVTGLAASAATLSGVAWADEAKKKTDSKDPRRAALDKVAIKAFECNEVGEACLRQAINLLRRKDNSLAECFDLSLNMTVICHAMARMASYDSAPKARMIEMLSVCERICRDCAVECRKHATHHAICNACMDACVACEEACKSASKII